MSRDPARDALNHEAMKRYDLDAVVCRLAENVLVLTGYWPLSGSAFAALSSEGRSALIVAPTEFSAIPDGAAVEVQTVPKPEENRTGEHALGQALSNMGVASGRIGIELNFESVAPAQGAGEVFVPAAGTRTMIAHAVPWATLMDAGPALNWARARKTPHEIDRLLHANAVAAFGLQAFRETYEPGRTEADVAAQVEAAIMSRGIGHQGARTARGWAHLMSGPESAWAHSPHPASSARRIEPGDLGVLELATVVDGYWSDLTRTLVAGCAPDERQEEMYGSILAGHEALMTYARPGMTGAQIDALARTEIEKRGLGDLFIHHTGHGLGFRYHEPQPFLAPGNGDVVKEGMVSSVEPGLYVEGWGGMRLEENVVFTEDGVQLLSVFEIGL